MKTKEIVKKLVFNKETISTLNNSAMNGLHGGVETLTCVDCETDFIICGGTDPEHCDPTWDQKTCVAPYTQCATGCELP